jgi:glycosyltransferase involved in cell wall biosynthesis
MVPGSNKEMMEGGARTRGQMAASIPGRPLVSIVTVVYNGSATLERTIGSVLGQTWPNIEYIIVDGGSTDGTIDLIRKYDDRLAYWTSGRDKGIYDAMNKGVALCRGEWVALINADDWYEPDTVQDVMRVARENPAAQVIHGDIWMRYPNGQRGLKKARMSGFLLKYWEMVLNHPSFFVRRGFYEGRPFDASLKVSADHKWTYEAWRDAAKHFVHIPRPLANFTVGGASMSVPLNRVLKEGRAVSRDLGMGTLDTFVGQLVRAALYPVQHLKLWLNQHVLSRRK